MAVPTMREFDYVSGLKMLRFQKILENKTYSCFDHCVTTRTGGVSSYPYDSLNLSYSTGDYKGNVDKNIHIAAHSIGSSLENVIAMDQCHSSNVGVVSSHVLKDKMRDIGYFSFYNVDALVTNEPGLCLLARSADCPLILLLDPNNKAIGVVHSGWRGTFLNIVNSAINSMMLNYGSDPVNIYAGLGPCISLSHYRVSKQNIELFQKKIPEEKFRNCYHFDGSKYSINLRKIISYQLMEAGLEEQNIEISDYCTFQEKDLFYSYRREGSKTGRFGLMAQIKKE